MGDSIQIHTPHGRLQKSERQRECEFLKEPHSVWFFRLVSSLRGVYTLFRSAQQVYLLGTYTPPLSWMFLKSSTGGVWNTNGVAKSWRLLHNQHLQNDHTSTSLPHKVKMQYVQCKLIASYFLSPWRNPAKMSRWSIS